MSQARTQVALRPVATPPPSVRREGPPAPDDLATEAGVRL